MDEKRRQAIQYRAILNRWEEEKIKTATELAAEIQNECPDITAKEQTEIGRLTKDLFFSWLNDNYPEKNEP
jgi:hypothetical protein